MQNTEKTCKKSLRRWTQQIGSTKSALKSWFVDVSLRNAAQPTAVGRWNSKKSRSCERVLKDTSGESGRPECHVVLRWSTLTLICLHKEVKCPIFGTKNPSLTVANPLRSEEFAVWYKWKYYSTMIRSLLMFNFNKFSLLSTKWCQFPSVTYTNLCQMIIKTPCNQKYKL
jgi:hypothetical protein